MEDRIRSIEDYASVESICDGVPVYSFNNLIYVYGQSPDFYPGVKMQKSNDNPVTKLKLKKVWEIENNFVGFCHEMTPRTRFNDSQPWLPIHLIDGDPDTMWASFESHVEDEREEWIRIDLPVETEITKINLVCNNRYMGRTKGFFMCPQWNYGCALPKRLTVKLSKDAWHWETVFANNDFLDYCGDAKPECVVIALEKPTRAKQILISANQLTKIGFQGYIFSVGGVEIINTSGENVALVSRGAGVTVSSVSNGHNSDRYFANSLWGPLMYDIGNKWVKMGSDNGSSLWCFTEHEK